MVLPIISAKTSYMKETWCKNLIPGIGQAKDKVIFFIEHCLGNREKKSMNGASGNLS